MGSYFYQDEEEAFIPIFLSKKIKIYASYLYFILKRRCSKLLVHVIKCREYNIYN